MDNPFRAAVYGNCAIFSANLMALYFWPNSTFLRGCLVFALVPMVTSIPGAYLEKLPSTEKKKSFAVRMIAISGMVTIALMVHEHFFFGSRAQSSATISSLSDFVSREFVIKLWVALAEELHQPFMLSRHLFTTAFIVSMINYFSIPAKNEQDLGSQMKPESKEDIKCE